MTTVSAPTILNFKKDEVAEILKKICNELLQEKYAVFSFSGTYKFITTVKDKLPHIQGVTCQLNYSAPMQWLGRAVLEFEKFSPDDGDARLVITGEAFHEGVFPEILKKLPVEDREKELSSVKLISSGQDMLVSFEFA